MIEVKTSTKGIPYLVSILKTKERTITKTVLQKIPHNSDKVDICLKIGRYVKGPFGFEILETEKPKSELTLDHEEFMKLIEFLKENYLPFSYGVKKYIPIDKDIDLKTAEHLKAIFANPDKQKLLNYIVKNDILPADLINGLENMKRKYAISEFETMLKNDLLENDWQKWFKSNSWILGSEYIRILDEREIDTKNISDYLMKAYDGFLDLIEIKRPDGHLKFWSEKRDHENYCPSSDLVKAITQCSNYLFEIEREADSVKFSDRVESIKVIKPRATLIFGRSDSWTNEQKQAYRILNTNYYNLTILTYDHVLARAKRILGLK